MWGVYASRYFPFSLLINFLSLADYLTGNFRNNIRVFFHIVVSIFCGYFCFEPTLFGELFLGTIHKCRQLCGINAKVE